MKTGVSNRQFSFILLLTLTTFSSIEIAGSMAKSSGYGSWLTILIASVIFACASLVVLYLNYKFEGEMFVDYSRKIIGTTPANIISIYYIFYFFILLVFSSIQLGVLIEENLLAKTPKLVIIATSLPVFCYIAYKGITTVARMAEYIGVIFLFVMIIILLLMLTQGNPYNVLPLFNARDTQKYLTAIKEAIFPFIGIEFLIVIPFTNNNGKSTLKTIFFTVIGIGLFYILIVESCIMKLGMNDIVHYNNSLITAIRTLDLEFLDFFKRLDILYLFVGITGIFLGFSILLTVTLDLLCKMFSDSKRLTLIIILGVLLFICSISFSKIDGFIEFVSKASIYMNISVMLIIPSFLIIIAKVKKYV